MNVKYYRKYIDKVIDINPMDIILTRYIEDDDGFGGKIKEKKELKPQVGTIYNDKSKKEITTESGKVIYSTTSAEKLLMRYHADVMKNDTFIKGNRKYRITFVKNYLNIYKLAELEVIK